MLQEELDYDEYVEAKKDMGEEPLSFEQWKQFNEFSDRKNTDLEKGEFKFNN